MSQVYSTEPSTTGQVILDTTHGPIDIHLWCKECPHTCRLFLQLALDGYYDSLPFHRIMQDFMIQTGQRPKINTSSHETDLPKERDAYFQYLEVQGGIKQDPVETMARIRFNHRGQVAMARSCDPAIAFKKDETHLRGQFFMTLDEATHLNDKHIIFGSIVGPTVFNALRIGRIEAAEDGSPMDMESCPLVKKVIIKDHPFTDLVMSKDIPWKISVNNASLDDKKKKKKKRKGKRDLNVLSFGNEEEEMDQIIHKEEAVGMKSSHDVIGIENGSSLSKNVDIQVAKLVYGDENKKLEKEKKKKSVKKDLNDEKLVLSSEKMQSSINHKDEDVKNYSNTDEKFQKLAPETSSNSSMLPSTLHSTNVTTETKVKTSLSKKTESKPKISAVEARRAKYLKKRKSPGDDPMASKKGKRDENTLSKLLAFRSKVMKIKGNPKNSGKTTKSVSYHGQILEQDSNDEDENKDQSDWIKTNFKCKKHVDDESLRKEKEMGQAIDDYVVIDEKRPMKISDRYGDKNQGRNQSSRYTKRQQQHGSHRGKVNSSFRNNEYRPSHHYGNRGRTHK